MFRAHKDLARAEFEAIGDEVKRAAALGGVAFAALLLLGLLLPIGVALFVGEWLFGSVGWGVLHASMLLVAVVVAAVMAALRVPGIATAFAVSLVLGALVAVLFGLNLPNQLYVQAGDALIPGIEPGVRPLVTGLAIGATIGGLLLLLLGARAGGPGGAIGGLIGGAVLGALAGAFSVITFPPHVAIAVGIALALALWPILMGMRVAGGGLDMDALKDRFWPATTIETTKETIEWIRARVPLGPKP